MASTGVNNGTIIGISIGGTVVSLSTEHSFNAAMSPIETSNKDSAGWKESIGGQLSGGVSGSAFFAEDSAYNFSDLWALMIARAAVEVIYTSGVTGDKNYTGDALLTSLERTAGVEDAETFSYSLEFTGAIAEGTEV